MLSNLIKHNAEIQVLKHIEIPQYTNLDDFESRLLGKQPLSIISQEETDLHEE